MNSLYSIFTYIFEISVRSVSVSRRYKGSLRTYTGDEGGAGTEWGGSPGLSTHGTDLNCTPVLTGWSSFSLPYRARTG